MVFKMNTTANVPLKSKHCVLLTKRESLNVSHTIFYSYHNLCELQILDLWRLKCQIQRKFVGAKDLFYSAFYSVNLIHSHATVRAVFRIRRFEQTSMPPPWGSIQEGLKALFSSVVNLRLPFGRHRNERWTDSLTQNKSRKVGKR